MIHITNLEEIIDLNVITILNFSEIMRICLLIFYYSLPQQINLPKLKIILKNRQSIIQKFIKNQ